MAETLVLDTTKQRKPLRGQTVNEARLERQRSAQRDRRAKLAVSREERSLRSSERAERARPYRAAARAPGKAASAITQRSSYSGTGMLTAELLVGFVLVLIRVVADFEVNDSGEAKGTVGHPQGQYGPLPILAGLIGSFFLLSFLAAAGGTRAKIAVIFGGTIVLTLGVNSLAAISKIATTFGAIGKITVPPPSGTPEGVLGATGSSNTSSSGSSSAPAPANSAHGAGSSSVDAGNRAIGAIQSPFTAITQGNFNIPGVVGKDAINLVKGLADYVNSIPKNIGGDLSSAWDSVKSLFGF